MGYICEARLEAGVELWRDNEPDAGCVFDGLLVMFGRGDAGTELFRSGAMLAVLLLEMCLSVDQLARVDAVQPLKRELGSYNPKLSLRLTLVVSARHAAFSDCWAAGAVVDVVKHGGSAVAATEMEQAPSLHCC